MITAASRSTGATTATDRIEEALDELAAQPDFVLVEVQSRDESVVVRKEGRSLRVILSSDEARIDVTVPLSTVKEFARHLRRISRDYEY